MADKHKLSRKELKKDDEFVVKGREIVDKLSDYTKPIIGGALAIFLLVVIGVGATISHRAKEAAAASDLGVALELAERLVIEGDKPEGMPGRTFSSEEEKKEALTKELKEVRSRHSDTAAGALASLYLARLAKEEENYDEAIRLYQEFLSEAPRGHKLSFSALEGIGAVHEARGDLDAALNAYSNLSSNAPSFYVPFGLLHEARILKALGREDEARRTAQRILDEHGETPATSGASDLLGRLPTAS